MANVIFRYQCDLCDQVALWFNALTGDVVCADHRNTIDPRLIRSIRYNDEDKINAFIAPF